MFRKLSFVFALLLPISGLAHNHAGDPASLPERAMAFAQTAPVTYQPGKGLADLQSWGTAFGEVVASNGTPYRMTTWTPFYANLAALPDIAQFDTLFFGIWPSLPTLAGWDGFFKTVLRFKPWTKSLFQATSELWPFCMRYRRARGNSSRATVSFVF